MLCVYKGLSFLQIVGSFGTKIRTDLKGASRLRCISRGWNSQESHIELSRKHGFIMHCKQSQMTLELVLFLIWSHLLVVMCHSC